MGKSRAHNLLKYAMNKLVEERGEPWNLEWGRPHYMHESEAPKPSSSAGKAYWKRVEVAIFPPSGYFRF
jgi:hypothetical protein